MDSILAIGKASEEIWRTAGNTADRATRVDEGEDKRTSAPVAIIDEDALRGKIHEVRGQKMMLDFELA